MAQAHSGSAVAAWDRRWGTAEGRAEWLKPEPAVATLSARLREAGARTALDLGCGVGRHALYLAEQGFAVDAIDGSGAGIAEAHAAAQARSLVVGLRQGSVDELPFADGSFDYVLSWNVIYHGNQGDVGRRIAEIWRVLRPGGHYQGTMLSARNANYRRGRAVAPDTFVLDGVEEKEHAHFYCDAGRLVALFAGFELLSMRQDEQGKPGAWHWELVAERQA